MLNQATTRHRRASEPVMTLLPRRGRRRQLHLDTLVDGSDEPVVAPDGAAEHEEAARGGGQLNAATRTTP